MVYVSSGFKLLVIGMYSVMLVRDERRFGSGLKEVLFKKSQLS